MTVGDCTPLSFPESEVRGGLARVSGWIDPRQHADTQAQMNLCFKIECTDKNPYRAHLPTSITVSEGPH